MSFCRLCFLLSSALGVDLFLQITYVWDLLNSIIMSLPSGEDILFLSCLSVVYKLLIHFKWELSETLHACLLPNADSHVLSLHLFFKELLLFFHACSLPYEVPILLQ